MSETPENTAPPKRFDDLLVELERIVDQLERAELPLEESLAAFERGVALSRRGQQILDEAEGKVELLLRDGSREPLDGDPDVRG